MTDGFRGPKIDDQLEISRLLDGASEDGSGMGLRGGRQLAEAKALKTFEGDS